MHPARAHTPNPFHPPTHTHTGTPGPALLQPQQPSSGLRPLPAQAIGELPEFKADARFAQHLVVNVPDMEAAVNFYTRGLNFQARRFFPTNQPFDHSAGQSLRLTIRIDPPNPSPNQTENRSSARAW